MRLQRYTQLVCTVSVCRSVAFIKKNKKTYNYYFKQCNLCGKKDTNIITIYEHDGKIFLKRVYKIYATRVTLILLNNK